MANPFDRFDQAPASNAFDKFDPGPDTSPFGQAVAAQAAQMQAQDAQQQDQPWWRNALDNVYNFGKAEQHHLGNLAVGTGQLLAHGWNAQAQTYDPNNPIRQSAANLARGIDSYAQKREQEYQAAIPDNAASYLGAATGEVAPWMLGIGEARALGLLPQATTKLGKLGTLAVEGGLIGTTQPVTTGPQQPNTIASLVAGGGGPSYAAQKTQQIGVGAATGPLFGLLGKGVGAAGSGLKNAAQHVFNPDVIANQNVARMLGNDPAMANALRSAPQLVPGENPSVAQVLQATEAVQAERALRNNPATAATFAAQDAANNQARLSLVQQLAGTDADMQAAKASRRAAVDPFVQQYLTDSRPVVRWSGAQEAFDSTLKNPGRMSASDFSSLKAANDVAAQVKSGAMQEDDAWAALKELEDGVDSKEALDAFAQARKAIDNNMVNPKPVLDALQTLKNGPLGVMGNNGAKLGELIDSIHGAANIRGRVGTDMLDAVRQEASKMFGNANSQGALAYGPAKNAITNAIERVAPGYRDYLATYARGSEPINTMEAVGGLLDPNAPGSLNASGDPQLALARVKQVLRQDDDAQYPMAKAARQQLENLRDSLLRRSVSDAKVAASGPSTAADLQATGLLSRAIFGPNLDVKGGLLSRTIGGGIGGLLGSHFGPLGAAAGASIGSGLSDAIGALNSRVTSRVGQKMANSSAAADAIDAYFARQRAAQQQGLLGYYVYGLPAASTTNP